MSEPETQESMEQRWLRERRETWDEVIAAADQAERAATAKAFAAALLDLRERVERLENEE